MKNLLAILFLTIASGIAFAQTSTESVTKTTIAPYAIIPGSTSGTASFSIPSGATLTISSGASIVNYGTATGFGSGVTSFNTRSGTVTLLPSDVNALSGLVINGVTLVNPILGTPASGNLANCTFPTLNQNTTGSAGSVGSGTYLPYLNGGVPSAATSSQVQTSIGSGVYDASGAATTAQAASLQKTNNLSDVSSPASTLGNLGLPSFVLPSCNIVTLSDSQSLPEPTLTPAVDWLYSWPGWLATMSIANNATVYDCSNPGQTAAFIYSAFSNSGMSLSGCTTTANSSTVTLGSASGVTLGMGIAGPGIPSNTVIYYSGSGTSATLFQGTGLVNNVTGNYSSPTYGPTTYSCTSGNYYIVQDNTTYYPAGVGVGGSVGALVVGAGIPANTFVTSISGYTTYLSHAVTATESTGTPGFIGMPAYATSTSGSATLFLAPQIDIVNYTNRYLVYNASPTKRWTSYSGVGQEMGYANSGINTVWDVCVGNNSYPVGGVGALSGTANGTSSVTSVSPTMGANNYAGYYVFANNGTYYGTVSSNTASTITLAATANPVTGSPVSGTIPSGSLTDLTLSPTSTLSGLESSASSLVSACLTTGTAATNTWLFMHTLKPCYGSSNSQATFLGVRLLYNQWVRLTYGGNAMAGVYVCDDGLLSVFQTNNSIYLTPDGTHMTYLGSQVVATNLSNVMAAALAPNGGVAGVSRNSVSNGALQTDVAFTDTPQTFTQPFSVYDAAGNLELGMPISGITPTPGSQPPPFLSLGVAGNSSTSGNPVWRNTIATGAQNLLFCNQIPTPSSGAMINFSGNGNGSIALLANLDPNGKTISGNSGGFVSELIQSGSDGSLSFVAGTGTTGNYANAATVFKVANSGSTTIKSGYGASPGSDSLTFGNTGGDGGGVVGGTNSTLPFSGMVGSVAITNTPASAPVTLISGTTTNYASTNIPPGRYLVDWQASYSGTSATFSDVQAGIWTNNATLPPEPFPCHQDGIVTLSSGTNTLSGSRWLMLTNSATIYGVIQANSSVGTGLNAWGYVHAVQMP